MPKITVEITDSPFDKNKIKSFLKNWGVVYQNLTKEAFESQGWEKNNWEPRSVPNVAGILTFLDETDRPSGGDLPERFFQDRPVLIGEGDLKDSITAGEVTENSVTVGTNKPYARTQHYGLVNFIKITERIKRNILALNPKKYGFMKPFMNMDTLRIQPKARKIFGWNDEAQESLIDTVKDTMGAKK